MRIFTGTQETIRLSPLGCNEWMFLSATGLCALGKKLGMITHGRGKGPVKAASGNKNGNFFRLLPGTFIQIRSDHLGIRKLFLQTVESYGTPNAPRLRKM